MSVIIKAAPRQTVTWAEFRRYKPYSIAVDGFCEGPPKSSHNGLVININHHDGVDRLATRASCDQALVLVKMGLYERFCDAGGEPKATLWINDCDQDVTLATFILKNPQTADNDKLKRLVRLEDLLDMSAGLFPVKQRMTQLRELCWIVQPYTESRLDRSLFKMDETSMLAVIAAMHKRVRSVIDGRGGELQPDTRYEVIQDYGEWQVVREIGSEARIGMSEDGITAFVSLMGSESGHHRYTIGRRSHFIHFPILKFASDLNRAEQFSETSADRWGGADNIVGSPRRLGSRLELSEVVSVIKNRLAKD